MIRLIITILIFLKVANSIHIRNSSDFQKQLNDAGDKLVVLEFTAIWCRPCKRIAPEFEELKKKFEDVVFLDADLDEAEDLVTAFDITSLPTFVFISKYYGQKFVIGDNIERVKATILDLQS